VTRGRLIAVGVVALLALGVVLLALVRLRGDAPDSDVAPTASITVAPVAARDLEDVGSAYGVVVADPTGSTTLAAPRAVVVASVLVRQGQTVTAGQPLVEVISAPGAELAYRQAADAATSAAADLARVQRLFDQHLAASDQLIAARKTLADAQAGLAAQRRQGAGRARQMLTAPAAAIVASLSASPGDHLAQDAPILVLARQGALSVKLAFEPSVTGLAVGQTVRLQPVGGGPPIETHLTMVGRAADPTSKTIDAIAPLAGAGLPIGSGVKADIVIGTHPGLSVPRAALVFDETGAHVFVVQGGVAKRVFVTAGRDHGDEVEVSGPITAGQSVAVQGAYELQDGMAVKVAGR